MVDEIRKLVKESDIEMLMKRVEKDSDFYLASELLMNFCNKDNVKKLLLEQWEKWKNINDYEHIQALMWRILDIKNLDKSIHNEIYEFLKNNKKKVDEEFNKWFGGPNGILDSVKERLSRKELTKSKAWIYLYVASISPNKEEALKLISKYKDSDDDFVRKIANDLISVLKK